VNPLPKGKEENWRPAAETRKEGGRGEERRKEDRLHPIPALEKKVSFFYLPKKRKRKKGKKLVRCRKAAEATRGKRGRISRTISATPRERGGEKRKKPFVAEQAGREKRKNQPVKLGFPAQGCSVGEGEDGMRSVLHNGLRRGAEANPEWDKEGNISH